VAAVDDDNINRSVVESLLDSTGYVVVSARNGRQALAHLASCKAMPDLVLLDVMMPDLSG
jgi:CheY-like chemotaxis protein